MRICVISSYPPNRARLSEYGMSLVKELADRPAISAVFVLADAVLGSKRRSTEGSKIEIFRVWKADSPLSILRILPQILKLKPDVVHFNIHFQSYGRKRIANFVGLSLVFLCRLLCLKVVVTLHNLAEKVDWQKVGFKNSLLNRVGVLVATKLVLSASRVVVTVRSYGKHLEQMYGKKGVLFIPHGISMSKCCPADPEEKVVLMFGHMCPSKGLPIGLKAFEMLLKERDNVRLVVAGSSHPNFPGYLDEFAKEPRQKVDFPGYVSAEDLPRLFCSADLVVLPYLTATGTSGVFHLACGYGRPVVASDLPEIREMVDEGAAAFLVPPGNVKVLKDAILKVLSNADLAAKMGEQNLMFARKEPWGMVAESYEETYKGLCACDAYE